MADNNLGSGGLGGLGGYSAAPPTADQLNSMYMTLFGRPADTGGSAFYTAPGQTWDSVYSTLANSDEGKAYAPQARVNQITSDYQNLFGRAPDQGGLNYFKDSGLDLSDIYDQMASSPEASAYAQSLGTPSWMDIIHQSDPLNDVQLAKGAPRNISDLMNDPNAIDMMAKGIYGEATRAGEGVSGEQAVMNTMLNRWITNGNKMPDGTAFPSDMSSILKQAYDAYSRGKAGSDVANATNNFGASDPNYQRIVDMIKQRLGGQLQDNTRGAVSYLNKAATLQNRGSLPSWASKLGNMQDIGQHTFMGQVPANLYPQGQVPSWFPVPQNIAPPDSFRADATPPAAVPGTTPGVFDPGAGFNPQTQLADALTQHDSRVNGAFGTDPTTSLFQNVNLTGNPAFSPPAIATPYPLDFGQVGPYNGLNVTPSSSGVQMPQPANPFPSNPFSFGSTAPSPTPTPQPPSTSTTTPWTGLLDALNSMGGSYQGF